MTSARCDHPNCVYIEGMTGMCRFCFGVFCLSHLNKHECRAKATTEEGNSAIDH